MHCQIKWLAARRQGLTIALFTVLLDAATKSWALTAESTGHLPLWLIPGQVGFHFAWNKGMSFSLLTNAWWGPYALGALATAACLWFAVWLGEKKTWQHQVGLGLLLGGALGNLVDRIQHGAVVDFLLFNPWHLFPYTFNVADSAITIGVPLLLLDSYLRRS